MATNQAMDAKQQNMHERFPRVFSKMPSGATQRWPGFLWWIQGDYTQGWQKSKN
jgi:hypothetical protein